VSPFPRMVLLGSTILTGLTGLIYWWMDAFLEPTNEWSIINHPWQPWILKAHILVAPVMVFAVGLVFADHIWRHVRARRPDGRRTGLTMLWIVAPMIMTGYLIQAVTAPGWLTALAWAHIGTGVLFLGGLSIHYWILGRRR